MISPLPILIYRYQPLDAITNRSKIDGTKVFSSLLDTNLTAAAETAAGKDVALVFITADSGETYSVEGNEADRNDLHAWHGGVSGSRFIVLHSSPNFNQGRTGKCCRSGKQEHNSSRPYGGADCGGGLD